MPFRMAISDAPTSAKTAIHSVAGPGIAEAIPERQLRRFLRAVYRAGKRWDIALVEMLSGTGLRVGELLALEVADVRLGKRSGRVAVREGKGVRRNVSLDGG